MRDFRKYILTLRHMGLRVTLLELMRRLTGLAYEIDGIVIGSSRSFRVVRDLRLAGLRPKREGEYVYARVPYGSIRVRAEDVDLLGVLSEDFGSMFGSAKVEGGVVVDIGAYIGETALFFLSRGARRVHAFEPVAKHYAYLVDNLSLNNVLDRVVAYNKGVWHQPGRLRVPYCGAETGLPDCERGDSVEYIEMDVDTLDSVLGQVYSEENALNLVKMDCEGCEAVLLHASEETVKLAEQYLVEVHGRPSPIVERMLRLGYLANRVYETPAFYVYHFRKTG